jgi:hypothetical protein
MPLRESDYDRKFIPVDAGTPLSQGMAEYLEKNGQEDWHFLVVQPDGSIGALKVSRLRLALARLGGRLYELTFAQLPIRVPTAAHEQREQIGIGVAETRAEDTASGVLAVMDGPQVIGRLDRSVRRSGQEVFPGSNMGSLYGSYISTHQDARAQWRPPGVTPPTCPHCRHQDFHDFDTSRMVYICRNCGEVI